MSTSKPQHIKGGKPQQPPKENPQVAIDAYKAAFGKHYAQTSVEVKRGKSRDGTPVYHVVLNGDKGDRPLTLDELKEATAAFLH